MGARRTARERALQALYGMEMSKVGPAEALEQAFASSAQEPEARQAADADPAARSFARELVEGVTANLEEIDALLEKHSHNWRLERMDRIDRNILRLGVFELKCRPDIPRKVTLNEAIELGKNFGTSESPSFINGLLDRVAVALDKA
jgi:N utilization substance protein B